MMCVKMGLSELIYMCIYVFLACLESRAEERARQQQDMEMAEVKESQRDPTCMCFSLKRMRLLQLLTVQIGLIRKVIYRKACVPD